MSIDGPPHATSTHSIARSTLPRASLSVLPCSVVTWRAIASAFSSSSALKRNMARARTTGGVSLHSGYAAAAALTARSTSAEVDSGVRPMTVHSAGLCTSRKEVADEGVQAPPM